MPTESDKIKKLGFDSLDTIEIMMDLEDRCDERISPEEFQAVETVEDLIKLCKKYKVRV
jgi:acyl carrier protein